MRLALTVPDPTLEVRSLVFGDAAALREPPRIPARRLLPARFSAPELSCLATAAGLATAGAPVVVPGLAGPDFGTWTGRSFDEVLRSDPAAAMAWLQEPDAAPHGGESLARHLARVGAALDGGEWPESGAEVVASAFTVRAACVHVLAAGPAALFHLDVGPGTSAAISRHAGSWRLASLVPARA
ncbi:histidine phosphatase family protein [Propionicimonas sp.]|uniref:histidine phosphatase family protein n=1 Tax=Propionicimonas sp. TaxID=1955623 RepID=UPI0039E66123